jgi:hypothetical protein
MQNVIHYGIDPNVSRKQFAKKTAHINENSMITCLKSIMGKIMLKIKITFYYLLMHCTKFYVF